MNNVKYISISLVILLFSACNNLSVNSNQVNSTFSNIQCYKDLVDEITMNEETENTILEIRDSKMRGDNDPVTVDPRFRSINVLELKDILSERWKGECYQKLKKEKDINGIRYINSSNVIIEIDRFKQHNLNDRFSKDYIIEIHRLIITDKILNGDLYKSATESIVWYKSLSPNIIYEISQYQTTY